MSAEMQYSSKQARQVLQSCKAVFEMCICEYLCGYLFVDYYLNISCVKCSKIVPIFQLA